MTAGTPPNAPIEVFVSYSHRDEPLRSVLEDHLSLLRRQGWISVWHDRMIGAGTEWVGQIDAHLESARVILLLVSAAFVGSDYCYDKEMHRALERHDAGDARVIPIILRPVDWSSAPFGKLQALPKDGKPVIEWRPRDRAFEDVTRGIRAAVVALSNRDTLQTTTPRARKELPARIRLEQLNIAGATAEVFVDMMRITCVAASDVARLANRSRYEEFVDIADRHLKELRDEVARWRTDLHEDFLAAWYDVQASLGWPLDRLRRGPTLNPDWPEFVLLMFELAEQVNRLIEVASPDDYAECARDAATAIERATQHRDARKYETPADAYVMVRFAAQSALLTWMRQAGSFGQRTVRDDMDRRLAIPYFSIDRQLLQRLALTTAPHSRLVKATGLQCRSELLRDKAGNVEYRYLHKGGKRHLHLRVCLEGAMEVLDSVTRVDYLLHPSFQRRLRTSGSRSNNFAVTFWTYGMFPIDITVNYKNGKTESFQDRLSFELPVDDRN